MTSLLWHIAVALAGAGLTLSGSLMLIRPELFSDGEPSSRGNGVGLILFGICALLLVFVYGLSPCGPDECTGF